MSAIDWQPDYETAVKVAKENNKPILLELYLDTCSHCARLHRETLVDPAVVAAVNDKFVPVRVEGRGRMDLVQKFEVRGAPTTLILSPEEQEKHRFVGFHNPTEYLQELAKIA